MQDYIQLVNKTSISSSYITEWSSSSNNRRSLSKTIAVLYFNANGLKEQNIVKATDI